MTKPDSVSKHNVTMSIDDAKKIAAGTHVISGLSGSEGRVILTPLTKDWVIVHAYGEWQVSDGPIGERCCSYDFDTKAEAEEYLKRLKAIENQPGS